MNNHTFIDTSDFARTISKVGTGIAQCSVSPSTPAIGVPYSTSQHGASVYLDGSSYLTVPYSSDLNPGTGDFTIEFWIYPTANTSSNNGEIFYSSTFSIYRNTNGSINFGNDSAGYYSFPAGSAPLSTWTHVCICRSSGTIRYFLNGVITNTVVDTRNFTLNSGQPLYVGTGYVITGWSFIGFIGGLKWVMGTADYTANFTPSPVFQKTTNTKLLLKFANIGVHDAAAKSPLITFGNVVRSSAQAKYGSNSVYFPGTAADYMLLPAGVNSMINLAARDFTMEFWFYPTTSTRMAIQAYTSDYSFGIDYHYNGSRNINIYASSTGSSWNMIHADPGGTGIGTISLNLNAWNHVAVVRSGNNFKTFINGVLDKNINVSGTIFTTNRGFRIGLWGTGTMPLLGYLDDFRLTLDLARYSSSFTPPNALPTA